MLACRLCLSFGEQDPEQWLESCPKRVLNIWRAFADVEGWHRERYLAAQSAVSLKRLVMFKVKEDSRQVVLKDIDKAANNHMPHDLQWSDDDVKPEMDESILKAMNRNGQVVSTPAFSTNIEADPWR
jgi:hypothetical protein